MRLAVVGAGLAGLTTAFLAVRAHPELDVVVLEADDRAGGRVRGAVEAGHTFDGGADGFHANVPDTLDLVTALGLRDRLRPATSNARRRYLYRDGALHALPGSVPAFLGSALLSPQGRLRAVAEPLLGRRRGREESVHDFLARHFGREAARLLAGVYVAALCVGDAREVSVDALFPRWRLLERSHGSLLRGLAEARRTARTARGAPETEAPGAGPATFDGGLGELAEALAAALGARLRTASRVVSLGDTGRPGGAPVTLSLADGTTLEADAVAIATPAHDAAALLGPTSPDAAAPLAAIRYVAAVVVGLGFARDDVPGALDAAGVWIPRGEGVRSTAVQWSSAVHPGHAPAGKVTLQVVGGGALDPGFVALDDAEVLASVRRDLARVMGIVAEPEARRLVRWPRGLPQFTLGHATRIAAARAALAVRWPRVALVGDYLDGLGVNDVVRGATAAARALTGVPRV